MLSLLAGLEDASGFDPRECAGFVGTSAGSIIAAILTAGIEPRSRLGDLPQQPPVPELVQNGGRELPRALRLGLAAGGAVGGPLAAFGLRSTERAGAVLRRAALSRVPTGRRSLATLGRELEEAGARWDGRLSVSAVELQTGRRVMFGAPGAPAVSVGTAVEASCAIPGVFRPVPVNGRSYVDGGAWSPTNMDCAPAGSGTQVLCLNPTGSIRLSPTTLFGGLRLLSRSLAAVEALALERRGARVTTVSPDEGAVTAMGPNLMDQARRAAVIEAGLAQGRALGRRAAHSPSPS
jgi:NTE family protein